jgi:hypothetical protein
MPLGSGLGNPPLPATFTAIASIALCVDHEVELGLVVASCAAEPGVRLLLGPEGALDLVH